MDKIEIILRTDDKAASLQTVTGWVSRNGNFYGKDERLARYDGSTHSLCECGKITRGKSWLKCGDCIDKASNERFKNLEFKEWDGKTPLCIHASDKYFYDTDDIEDYLEENGLNMDDIDLVICEPNYFTEITGEQWDEILPENSGGEIPKELKNKLKEFNEFISKLPPISWSEGKFRTIIEI